jgi:5-methylcytosine-specific restriction endonuclease McrA
MHKNCAQCGALFPKLPSHSMNAWLTRVKFCSKQCYTASQKGQPMKASTKGLPPPNKGMKMGRSPRYARVDHQCAKCSTTFTVQSHRVKEGLCCSRACSYALRDKGISTENEKARKSVAYREWRESVFKRDDFTCQACGLRGGEINADHILPFAFHPELRYALDNGRTLCVPCHRATPTYGRGARRSVIAVGQEA